MRLKLKRTQPSYYHFCIPEQDRQPPPSSSPQFLVFNWNFTLSAAVDCDSAAQRGCFGLLDPDNMIVDTSKQHARPHSSHFTLLTARCALVSISSIPSPSVYVNRLVAVAEVWFMPPGCWSVFKHLCFRPNMDAERTDLNIQIQNSLQGLAKQDDVENVQIIINQCNIVSFWCVWNTKLPICGVNIMW